ncbi:IS701 family transposase [candidate division KSB1 bacterium]|nr:IS701 family transposase [candidate division KSB1 bacterium]
MRAAKRNMERMVERVPDSDWQSQQNFISNSPWDSSALMKQIARDVDAILGHDTDTCLIIDESAMTKKGHKSVGVTRQWNGRLGKIDNCQVGVFAALNCRHRVSLVDVRLFLPESWTSDRRRCHEAKVPLEQRQFRKKAELALEMVASARHNGLSFNWIGADGFYGNDPKLLRQLDQMGETFMLDVHCDQTIYTEDPQPYLPPPRSGRGRKPVRLKTDIPSITVADWANQQPDDAWQTVFTRQSTRGPLTVKVLHRRVWLWDNKEQQAHLWHLIVSRGHNSRNELKYSVSNAAPDTTVARLAFMQGQRYWVERALEDGKSTVGLAEYQVRGWTGWHHHMALVMLSMLFILKTKIKYKKVHHLLSGNDVRILLYHFLPQRETPKQEVLRQMAVRHQQRLKSILSYSKLRI